jgi:inorganic pyrophosphatase
MSEIDVIVSTPKGSVMMYDYNDKYKLFSCKKQLSKKCELNIGFLPNTLSNNGTNLEGVILVNEPLIMGSMIQCKIIGSFDSEHGTNKASHKQILLLAPSQNVTDEWDNYDDIYCEINGKKTVYENVKHMLDEIQYFYNQSTFFSYKPFYDKHFALKLYCESVEKYSIKNCMTPNNSNKYNSSKYNSMKYDINNFTPFYISNADFYIV